jgi:hypothetical protein
LSIEVKALGSHAGEIDHHPTLIQTVTGRAVTTAAHVKGMSCSIATCMQVAHVLRITAHRHQRLVARSMRPVVDNERLIVAGHACLEQVSGQFHP